MLKLYTLSALLLLIILASCSGSRTGTRSDERDLRTLINRLNKKGATPEIVADLRTAYDNARVRYENNLYNAYFEQVPQRWDRVISSLSSLQRLYETVSLNAYAMRTLKPDNVNPRLLLTKDSAAADFYRFGEEQLQLGERENARQAYLAFRKAGEYVPNYRNSRQLMQQAYELGMVNVLINPVQYDEFGNNNWNWGGFGNRDRLMQDNLIRDLGGAFAQNFPARFYNEYELRRLRLSPDMVVDLVWRNVRFEAPMDQVRNMNRSKQIEIGRDTAGKPVYQTVNATLQITRRMMNVNGTLQMIVNDVVNRRQVRWEQIPADYRFEYEFASFNGDRRALTNEDWALINNTGRNMPSREELMDEMMRRIYQQLLQRIRSAVNW